MIIDDKRPSLMIEDDRSAEEPVLQTTVTCDRVYNPDLPLSCLHFHDGIELSVVTAGYGYHVLWDEVIPCEKGDVFVLNTGVPHAIFAQSEVQPPVVSRLLFDGGELFTGPWGCPEDPAFCQGIFAENPLMAHAHLSGLTLDFFKSTYAQLAQEIECKQHGWMDAVHALMVLLLTTVSRDLEQSAAANSVLSREQILVAAAIREITEGYGDPGLTLSSVAKHRYVSESYLSRLFFRVTGEHFGDYLRNVRLEQAARRLEQTEQSVRSVAETCGFRDIPSFYRAFGRRFGLPPGEHRQMIFNHSSEGETSMSLLQEISENLQRGKAKIVKELVQQAVDEGIPAEQILSEGLLAGMSVIGEKFKNNEVYVPEVLVAARAMNMGAQVLKPLIQEAGVQASGRVCIGTVRGDLHDIGKNLVKMMMEGKGLEVVDLGTDVSPETYIQTAIEQNCQVICCSALLTTTMNVMEDVVKAAEAAGIRDRVKIMVGGAPVTQEFCEKIGADAYTSDAASAADMALSLCR